MPWHRMWICPRVEVVTLRRDLGVWLLGGFLALAASAPVQGDSGSEFFEKSVRPLLASNCFSCHSSAGNVAMGGLRLDSRDSLLMGGSRGPAVLPGDVEASRLVQAVRQQDEKLSMPPTGKLSDGEIAILERWVRLGAPWGAEPPSQDLSKDAHWSFVAPEDPVVPAFSNPDWVRTPVDAFVLSRLESEDLGPAPPADRRTLIRRVYFDLIGLPPRPEDIAEFLEDDSPGAFSRVIDRLLASPRYGERWGRHWLDVARYSDSNGVDENLVYKNAYRYRDYVIDAFNKDKPYDAFIAEQIAGDLLKPTENLEAQFERWTATGFLTLGPKMLAEDDPVKMQMDIVDEQLDTTARAFMGLTVGCARCHDHKFDPIPTADYYALAGIFKSSKTMENFKVVAEWHEYVLASRLDRDRLEAHRKSIQAKQDEIAAITEAHSERLVVAGWTRAGDYLLAADEVLRSRNLEIAPILSEGEVVSAIVGTALREAGDFDRGNVSRKLVKGERNAVPRAKRPYYAEYDLEVGMAGKYQLDFKALATGSGTANILINGLLMKEGLPAVNNRVASPDAAGWSVAGVFSLETGVNTIRLEHPSLFPYFESLAIAPSRLAESAEVPTTEAQAVRRYDLNPEFLKQWVERLKRDRGATASILYAWHAYRDGNPLDSWPSPAAKALGGRAHDSKEQLATRYQELFDRAVERWRVLHPEAVSINYENERYKEHGEEPSLPDPGLEQFRAFLYEKYGPFRPPKSARTYYPADVQQRLSKLDQELKALQASTPEFPRAMGVREGSEIGDIPIHLRGSHWTLGESVPRGFLSAISYGPQPEIPEGASGRLQLAEWLTSPDHPLTARVMVNRLWRWHFGRGIVPSTDNFGLLGQPPSNQPLLDWLASEFIRSDWSIKRMHRLILLSSTYRMSSAYDEKANATDPENNLLWRANRRRLEAEPMRDAIVYLSDDLDLSMGGSILDVRDRARVASTRSRGNLDYDRNRRAVYLPVVRSSLYDVFGAFEFADPSVPNGNRGEAVVAPQALFMMNGSLMLQHTRKMADQLLEDEHLDDAGKVRDTYERVLGRLPRPAEIDRALTFIANIEKALGGRAADSRERRARAWQSFCKAMIGSSEFLYIN